MSQARNRAHTGATHASSSTRHKYVPASLIGLDAYYIGCLDQQMTLPAIRIAVSYYYYYYYKDDRHDKKRTIKKHPSRSRVVVV